MFKEKSKKSGITRILAALGYSVNGLRAAFNSEDAFRQEIILFIVFLPLIYYLPASHVFKALLFLTNTLVLIIELLNSAIEAIVDLASPEYHELAKRAKDMGSAAVMISILLSLILWGYALLDVM